MESCEKYIYHFPIYEERRAGWVVNTPNEMPLSISALGSEFTPVDSAFWDRWNKYELSIVEVAVDEIDFSPPL